MDLTYDTQNWAKLQMSPADRSASYTVPQAGAGLSESAIWSAFAKAVEGDGAPAVTARSVLLTMALLDAARRSSTGGVCISVADAFQSVQDCDA